MPLPCCRSARTSTSLLELFVEVQALFAGFQIDDNDDDGDDDDDDDEDDDDDDDDGGDDDEEADDVVDLLYSGVLANFA